MTIPTYLPYFVLVSASAIIATILVSLRNALAQAAWPKHDRATALRFFAVILISWFLVALALGLAGDAASQHHRLNRINPASVAADGGAQAWQGDAPCVASCIPAGILCNQVLRAALRPRNRL